LQTAPIVFRSARWHLPGDGPQPYAVYVDETDAVWVSDWGANAILRFTVRWPVLPEKARPFWTSPKDCATNAGRLPPGCSQQPLSWLGGSTGNSPASLAASWRVM